MVKFEQHQYQRAMKEAQTIAEIASKLQTIKHLEAQNVLKPASIDENFEKNSLRDMKNALSNIYLMLELNEVEGIADQIFNQDFVPKK